MNAIVVTVNEHPVSRLRALSAAQLAAANRCSLHLVSGAPNHFADTITVGTDCFFVDTLDAFDRILIDLANELQHIVPTTHSTIKSRPATAALREAKRINASMIFDACTVASRRFNRRQQVSRGAFVTGPLVVAN